jgi:ribosomal protein L19E
VDAQTELAKLGQSVGEIENTTEAVLLLATAAGRDVPQAAEVAQQTLNQFGLDASEAGRVVDVMAKSFTSSALDLDRWQASFKSAGAAANAVGATLEDTAAAISVLVDAGIPAEKAGTDLRNIFIALEQEGLSWAEALDGITNEQNKLTAAVDLFDKRSGVAGVILADNVRKTEQLSDAYSDAAGSARELADAQLDNLKGDRLLFAAAWEEFLLSVEDGTGVVGVLARELTQIGTAAINAFTPAKGSAQELKTTIEALGKEQNKIVTGLNALKLIETLRLRGIQRSATAEGELNKLIAKRAELIEKADSAPIASQRLSAYRQLQQVNEQILEIEKQITDEKEKQWTRHLEAISNYHKQRDIQKQIKDEIDATNKPILAGLQEELKNLRTKREQATTVGEIKTLNKEIEAIQIRINNLLGNTAARTREVKKETTDWKNLLLTVIDIEDKQAKRESIPSGFATSAAEGDFVQNLINERIKAEIDAQQKIEDEKTRIAKEGEQRRRDLQVAAIQFLGELGSGLVRNEQERLNRRLRNEQDFLEKLRQTNEISQEEYERLTIEAQKRQFRETQRLRLQEATINMAAAIATILAQQGLPAGLGSIASATALGAAQIATISAAQFAKGGMLQGDSHERGGIPVSVGGKRIVEAEGGEAIINKKSTAMFRDQLSAINQAGGGVKFARGGMLSAPRATVGMGAPTQRIDYDQMAAAFANVNIETSIVEIQNAQSLQNKIASIRRL